MLKIKLGSSKNLLKEIKMEDVLPRLDGKQFIKIYKELLYNFLLFRLFDPRNELIKKEIDENFSSYLAVAKYYFSEQLPNVLASNDIKERYFPEIINWILTLFLRGISKGDFGLDGGVNFYIDDFYGKNSKIKSLEIFYQIKDQGIQRILSKSDINQIQSPQELVEIVEAAKPAYEQFKEKKLQKDAGAGMNKIFENSEWQIFIPETKAAACVLGKGTDWCTAGPGLNYYEQYHSKENPLIIFISKLYPAEIKYQFHFGTTQFMNKKDHPIEDAEKDELFLLLRQIDNSLIRNLMHVFMQNRGLVFYTSTLANTVGLYRAHKRYGEIVALSPTEEAPRTIEYDENFRFQPETSTSDSSIYEEIFVDKNTKAIFDVRAKTISTNKDSYSKHFPDLNKLLSSGWTLEERPQR